MWDYLLSAVALLLVFEGIMPYLSPRRWRTMIQKLANQPDKTLRIMGLISMLTGLGLLTVLQWIDLLQ